MPPSEPQRPLDAGLDAELARAHAVSAAKSVFISTMSHELRTPLNAILGFAQLLERDRRETLTPRQRERLAFILSGTEHLAKLVDDIVELSRIESGAMSVTLQPVRVEELVEEVTSMLAESAARADVRLESVTASDAAELALVDRTRCKQVLLNLGSNAVKYNQRGGRVRFHTQPLDTDHLRISVADTGLGIPLDKQARLFQPFERAGQELGSVPGTGLGLGGVPNFSWIISIT